MDIAGISMAMSQIDTSNQVGIAMLSKSLDTTETLGQGMVDMMQKSAMENSVMPHVGGNFDMTV